MIATNLRAIEKKSGIPYNKLSYWFRNGTILKDTDEFFILKSASIIKGKQKFNKKGQSSEGPTSEPEDSDYFEKLLKDNV